MNEDKIWDGMSILDRKRLIHSIHWYDEKEIKVLADATWLQLFNLQYNLALVLATKIAQKRFRPY